MTTEQLTEWRKVERWLLVQRSLRRARRRSLSVAYLLNWSA